MQLRDSSTLCPGHTDGYKHEANHIQRQNSGGAGTTPPRRTLSRTTTVQSHCQWRQCLVDRPRLLTTITTPRRSIYYTTTTAVNCIASPHHHLHTILVSLGTPILLNWKWVTWAMILINQCWFKRAGAHLNIRLIWDKVENSHLIEGKLCEFQSGSNA